MAANTRQRRPSLTLKSINLRSEQEEKVKKIITPSAQEVDGKFLESYNGIANSVHHQMKKLLKKVDEHLANERASQTQHDIENNMAKIKLDPCSYDQWMNICGEVMHIIMNRFGTDDFNQSTKGLLAYVKDVFGLEQVQFSDLFQKAKDRPPPKSLVKVTVLAARDLEAKDVNGFSDPFCMLGIVKSTDADFRREVPIHSGGSIKKKKKKEKKLKRASSSKQSIASTDESTDDLFEGKIVMTSIQYENLNPVWNETFQFEVDNVQNDILHIDMWDHDDDVTVLDAASKVMNIKGVTGISRYFKQVLQSATTASDESVDDFLGCIDIPLSQISATGTEGWYDLQARSSRSNVQGQLHLNINFSTSRGGGHRMYDAKEFYTAVHEKFAEYDAEQFFIQNSNRLWDCDLSVQALSILSQIAMHYDITQFQQSMYKINDCKQIDYKVLVGDLRQITDNSPELSPEEMDEFIASLSAFVDRSMTLLRHVRYIFPYKDDKSAKRLENLLSCLEIIYSISEFKRRDLNRTLEKDSRQAFKEGTKKWYINQVALESPKILTMKAEFKAFIQLANKLFLDLYAAKNYYSNLFARVGHDYFATCFFTLDELVGNDVKKIMEEVNQMDIQDSEKVEMLTFQLYFTLKELTYYRKQLEPEDQNEKLVLDSLYLWFTPFIKMWFDCAYEKCLARISKAIEVEQVEIIDSFVKYSTSAVDVSCCIEQICEFWRRLGWPDADGAYVLLMKIVDDICTAGIYYGERVNDKLNKVSYYDDEGQFDITEQLCISLNNLDHIRRALQKLPKNLDFDAVVKGLQHHGTVHADDCKTTLLKIMESGDEDLNDKILSIIEKIGMKMSLNVKTYTLKFSKAPDSEEVYQAITPLLEYLDSNLITLSECLFGSVFDKIVIKILNVVMEMYCYLVKAKTVKPAKYYERLWDGLQALTEFFLADGNGVEMKVILNDEFYQTSIAYLTKAKLDTASLIGLYFKNKLEYQANATGMFGSLVVKVFYSSTAQSLFVNVISARALPALDSNGLADPYVIVDLCPHHVFKCSEKTTRVVKKTLQPYFGETFTFNISDKLCLTEGAVVLFTVMDYNLITKNDYAGECVLSLNDVPGLSWDENVPGMGADLPEIELKLTHPSTSGEVFAVLNSRASCDKEAMAFVKKRRSMYEAAQESIS